MNSSTTSLQDYTTFAMAHWELCLAFILILLYWLACEFETFFNTHGLSPNHVINLMNHHEAIIIDIREKEVFKKSHILNSVSIPHTELMADLKTSLKKYKNKKIILVDNTGNLSNKLINKIIDLDHNKKEIFFLKNGLNAWTDQKLPLEKK